MRPLHNFRIGPLPSDDHPAFNAVEERNAFLNAFRERGQNLCRIHYLPWLTDSPRRGKLLKLAQMVLRNVVLQRHVPNFDTQ